MHYKNGREAKNGDKIVLIGNSWKNEKGETVWPSGYPITGILYDAQAGNDFCNGRLAAISPSDPTPNLKECLHVDDALAMLAGDVPDGSKK